jgi:hypothetical protein
VGSGHRALSQILGGVRANRNFVTEVRVQLRQELERRIHERGVMKIGAISGLLPQYG